MRLFADYVAIVDGLLRADDVTFSYSGTRLWVKDVATAPGCVQSPRPPIILGGQSPTVLRTAAERADVWNTHGPPGASDLETLRATADQSVRLDRHAEAAGRDPAAIRRSYTIFGQWDPRWGRHGYEEVFDSFGGIGVSDFVLDWPGDAHRDEFERVAADVIPGSGRLFTRSGPAQTPGRSRTGCRSLSRWAGGSIPCLPCSDMSSRASMVLVQDRSVPGSVSRSRWKTGSSGRWSCLRTSAGVLDAFAGDRLGTERLYDKSARRSPVGGQWWCGRPCSFVEAGQQFGEGGRGVVLGSPPEFGVGAGGVHQWQS